MEEQKNLFTFTEILGLTIGFVAAFIGLLGLSVAIFAVFNMKDINLLVVPLSLIIVLWGFFRIVKSS